VPKALLVDDDKNSLGALAELVGAEGFDVRTAASLAEARDALTQGAVDIALVDLQLPDGAGIELVRELEAQAGIEVVIITGHGTVDTAVESLKRGAIDYMTKPVDLTRLRTSLARVREKADLREEIVELRGELRRLGKFGAMIGASSAMQQVYDLVARVAPTDSTVLVTGETGVGKELVARMVHQLSRRVKKPFLPINCGAVPPTLIESELFGHEKGSFTGAERQRKGIFERAHGGTLFLDEITEMPIELQVKLLRVLETGRVTRVGAEKPEEVDVRIVAATNRDPEEAASSGQLRRDLLYRIHVFPIHVPPLRERGADVDLLVRQFLDDLNRVADAKKEMSEPAMALLRAHAWPGNVRELKNVVERAFILARDTIGTEHVPLGSAPIHVPQSGSNLTLRVGNSVADAERALILATLDQLKGNKREAARVLGLSLKTLYNRLKEYGQ
jgi:two-component system, NtrC family, response regulator HydG